MSETTEKRPVMLALFPNEDDGARINALVQGSGLLPNQHDLHLTLMYLTDDDTTIEDQLPALRDALINEFTSKWGAVTASINGIGRFYDHDPNAVYANVDSPDLPAIRSKLEQLVSESGIVAISEHGFTPHITLGYLPADQETPTIKVEPFDVQLSSFRLCCGDNHTIYDLNKPETKALDEVGEIDLPSDSEKMATKAVTRYDHIDFTPPHEVVAAAQRSLELHKEHGCATLICQARARSLASGNPSSAPTIKRMMSHFAKHNNKTEQQIRNTDKTSPAYISWLSHGGDSGRAWASNLMKQIHQADDMKSFRVYRGDDGLRYMLLVSATSYKDRENEWIETKAMQSDTELRWKGDQFTGFTPLMYWHDDPDKHPERAIGQIVWADMQGPLLIEVAKELKSDYGLGEPLNLPKSYAEGIWDYIESNPDGIDWGASIGFTYLDSQKVKRDNVYKGITKFETSVLPLNNASNGYTFAGIANMGERDDSLDRMFGAGSSKKLRASADKKIKVLENAGVKHKELDSMGKKDAVDTAVEEQEVIAQPEDELISLKDDTFVSELDEAGNPVLNNKTADEDDSTEVDEMSPEEVAKEILAVATNKSLSESVKVKQISSIVVGLLDDSDDSALNDATDTTSATLALSKSLIKTQKALADEFAQLAADVSALESGAEEQLTKRKALDDTNNERFNDVIKTLDKRVIELERQLKMRPRMASRDASTEVGEGSEDAQVALTVETARKSGNGASTLEWMRKSS